MSIQVGEPLPSGALTQVSATGASTTSSEDLFSGKKVVLFGIPGAFTPTCSEAHLPGFIENYDAIMAKGVDTVACITVNDPFVVAAWAAAKEVEHIMMLADGNADYITALGMNVDMSARGFGVRSARFAMIVENGEAIYVAREDVPKNHDVSSAHSVLAFLER